MIQNLPNIQDEKGNLHSIYPCQGYLTFGPWIYLVPQYKPKSVLMLGYAGGTAAGLIRMFYGDIPITCVDILDCSDMNFYGVELVKADAKDYVKSSSKFDCVIVDIYKEGDQTEKFVTSKEFVRDVSKIANYIIVHATEKDDMSEYNDLRKIKTLTLPFNGDIPDGKFHYYMVTEIHSLPVR